MGTIWILSTNWGQERFFLAFLIEVFINLPHLVSVLLTYLLFKKTRLDFLIVFNLNFTGLFYNSFGIELRLRGWNAKNLLKYPRKLKVTIFHYFIAIPLVRLRFL